MNKTILISANRHRQMCGNGNRYSENRNDLFHSRGHKTKRFVVTCSQESENHSVYNPKTEYYKRMPIKTKKKTTERKGKAPLIKCSLWEVKVISLINIGASMSVAKQ